MLPGEIEAERGTDFKKDGSPLDNQHIHSLRVLGSEAGCTLLLGDDKMKPEIDNSPLSSHRKNLQELLNLYVVRYPNEHETVERMRLFINDHSDCFERTCMPGHITGSAWIISPNRSKYLMTRHRIFDRWLQLGGHADGCPLPYLVALREAEEESGLADFGLYRQPEGFVPLDIDIHKIAPRSGTEGHEHYDIRYLLIAIAEQPLRISEESYDLTWFDKKELENITQEESVLRMLHKCEIILSNSQSEIVYNAS